MPFMLQRTPIRRKPLPRATKPIAKIGRRGQAKIDQKRAHKLAYAQAHGGMLNGIPVAPCQLCEKVIPLQAADFSHKVPAGRGGDKGGQVQAANGCWSCRACHEFVERNTAARKEFIASVASCLDGGTVRFSLEVSEQHAEFLRVWHGNA